MSETTKAPVSSTLAAALFDCADVELDGEALVPGQALPLILTPQGPVSYRPLGREQGKALLRDLLRGKGPELRGFLLYGEDRPALVEYDCQLGALKAFVDERLLPTPLGRRSRLSSLAAGRMGYA
jgi:hypothetical protein